MLLRKMGKTLRRSLTAMLAAVVVVTSAPQLSMGVMAQEIESEGVTSEVDPVVTEEADNPSAEEEETVDEVVDEQEADEETTVEETAEDEATEEAQADEPVVEDEVGNTEGELADTVEPLKGEDATNKALRFDLEAATEWTDYIQQDVKGFEDVTDITADYSISYDLYISADAAFTGNYYIKPVVKVGETGTWTQNDAEDQIAQPGSSDFTACDDNENLLKYTYTGKIGTAVDSHIHAVVVSVGSSTASYDGAMFVDNVRILNADGDVVATQDFNSDESAVELGNMEGITSGQGGEDDGPVQTTNKALRFEVSAVNGDYTNVIDEPVEGFSDTGIYGESGLQADYAISYDLYIPKDTTFTGDYYIKPVVKLGADWTWTDGDSADGKSVGSSDFAACEESVSLVKYTYTGKLGTAVAEANSYIAAIEVVLGSSSVGYEGVIFVDNVKLLNAEGATLAVNDFASDASAVELGNMDGITSGQGGDDDNEPDDDNPVDGTVIYQNDFDGLTELGTLTLATLAEGNQAVEYTVDLSGSTSWTDIFKAELNLETCYDEKINEKLTMSYDVYFPADSINEATFGTMKAQAAMKCNDAWAWASQNSWPAYTTADLTEDTAVPGYKKLHVSIDMNDFTVYVGDETESWTISDVTSVKTAIPCFAGDTSTYAGKVYLDNVVLADTSSKEAGKPETTEETVYSNDFNAETDDAYVEIATGNKAAKYTIDLTDTTSWTNVFQAVFNLSPSYDKAISDKLTMSYDVYFPAEDIDEATFGTMKAQAAMQCNSAWTWTSQNSWPAYTTADLTEDAAVPGYKKLHVSIDMNDFTANLEEETASWTIANITSIKTVIPCLAGDVSGYKGDVYLDNLVVKAYNKSDSEELPEVDDIVLSLDASAWATNPAEDYQYTGTTALSNETIGDAAMLVAKVDYSNDKGQSWSEAKLNYTHAETVASMAGYNTFAADIYYNPENMSAGKFKVKVFSQNADGSKLIEKDVYLPEGTAVTDIPALEGYYKSELVLTYISQDVAFSGLTLGLVGEKTDYVGNIYFDNMRFTQVIAEDIYVDSTVVAKKGAGITVSEDGRTLTTESGQTVAIASEVALVDANAMEETKNLYAYLKAVGESDSVIFGHQNDTHHKAGNASLSNSDTKDVTGSIAGVLGLDTLSLTGNEAMTWDTPEKDRIANLEALTEAAAAEGAIITLSCHMPNFELIDQRVKNFEENGGSSSEEVGYWVVEGEKQYNFSGYTPGTLTGNIVERIMPGQDLNYLYTDYLDLIVDYAKSVEDKGVTILFRPFHENTGSWFWWGAALCDEQAYINLYRYTVDYMKSNDVHNMLYVYGPGSEAANTAEYGARYPGDAYVDMIGYDLYHQMPTAANEADYLSNVSKQNAILKEFASSRGKLYAITETGVANSGAALKPSGNEVKDWYQQLLATIKDDGVCYFLVWANFNDTDSFYVPFVTEQKENGILHGHEMLDDFINMYNDAASVFATDMNNGYTKVKGVTNTTKAEAISGYILTPTSGSRLIAAEDETDDAVLMSAKIAGATETATVQFIVTSEEDQTVIKAAYNAESGLWEAVLTESQLKDLGQGTGTITLKVNGAEIAFNTIIFNVEEVEADPLVPEDFEGYSGNNVLLNGAWATNKATGSDVKFSLTDETDKVFGGNYGLEISATLGSSDAWVGATKSLGTDWSEGNALEFYTIPEKNGQKVVVQVTSGGAVFEVYLQEYEVYTANAASEIPVKVTIPFSAFVGRDNAAAVFDPTSIESIGLWCNAIANEKVSFPLDTKIYYDELKVVTTQETEITIEGTAKEGIWMEEIPEYTYTGKAIKPAVKVYDGAKLLTEKKDYTVSYKNNTSAGTATVTVKGKGNYNETITENFVINQKSINEVTVTAPEYIVYNKKEQKISVSVKDGSKSLSTKDYIKTITYKGEKGEDEGVVVTKAKEKGIYEIEIAGTRNYTDSKTVTLEVVEAKLLNKASLKLPSSSLDYKQGEEVKFEDESKIIVKLNGKEVPKDAYTISYDNNKKVSKEAIIKITAVEGSGYVGSLSKKFTIKGTDFKGSNIKLTGFEKSVTYTGKARFQALTLTDKKTGDELVKNEDYKIVYSNNVNAGKATVTLTGLGKYSGTIKKTYTISKAKLTVDMVTTKKMTAEQNRAGATVEPTIVYNGMVLEKDVDYTLSYSNNKNTTTDTKKAYVTIKGKGNYTGTLNKAVEFEITAKAWDSTDIEIVVADVKYNKNTKEYKPSVTVYDNGKKLANKKDYTFVYADNKKADVELNEEGYDVAKVIVSAKGKDYQAGERTVEFRITSKLIKDAKVEVINPQYFSQQGVRPTKEDLKVTFKVGKVWEEVEEDSYEIISYGTNAKKGKGTLVLQGLGEYGGTKTVTFTIKERGILTNLTKAFDAVSTFFSNIF